MTVPMEAALIMNQQYPALKNQTDAWLKKITKAFTDINLNSTIYSFQSSYSISDSDFLKVMSEMIKIKSHEELSQAQISDAKENLINLTDEIIKSDLEDKLKNYLIKSIRRIITALEDYQLNGTVPIIESIEIMMGHTFTDKNYRSSLNTPIGEKIFSVVGAVANIVTIAAGFPSTDWVQIGQALTKKIPQL